MPKKWLLGTFQTSEVTIMSKKIGFEKKDFLTFFDPQRVPRVARGCPYISASRMKYKNRLGDPESIHQRGFQKKFEPIRPSRLGCRGGC